MKPECQESRYSADKIDKELWKVIRDIIFEEGHLCYEDDEGCHYVLRNIIEVLKNYNIKLKNKIDKESIKTELYISDDSYGLTTDVMIQTCKQLFRLANEAGLDGIKLKNIQFAERPSGPLNLTFYKLFKWEVDA